MKKDAYYFPHDSNAKDDPKCILLIEQLGLEGYGIYWVLIETLRDQPNYCYPLQLLPALARRFNTTFEKMKAVVSSYNLFIIKDERLFFSQSLVERMQMLEDKRKKRSLAGIKGNEKRWGNQLAIAPQSQCDHNGSQVNNIKEYKIKVNKSKEKKSKEEDVTGKTSRFSAPSIDDIQSFLINDKKVNTEDAAYYAQRFINFYESKNWMVGKNKMTNWKTAAVRSLEWEDKRQKNQASGSHFESFQDKAFKQVQNLQ